MKPIEFWEMEAVFIFTGIVILLVAVAIGFLAAKALEIRDKRPEQEQEEEDPCDTCTRWCECNGVDENCPRKNHSNTSLNGDCT